MLQRLLMGFLAFALISVSAQAGELQGPMRLRDLSPFALNRLDFQPTAAISAVPRHWALELHFAQANTYVLDKKTAKFLGNRPPRTPLRAADVTGLESQGRDYYFYDGAISILNLTGHYALGEHWALYAAVPVHHYGGGFMDSTIEGFHQFWGLDDAHRPLVPRNGYQVAMRLNGQQYSDLNPGSTTRFSDPTVGLRFRDLRWGDWDIVLEGAGKLPVGNDLPFFSSGAVDLGLQVSLQRRWVDRGVFVSISDVFRGRPELFSNNYRKRIMSVTGAYEQALNSDFNLVAQLTLAQSVFRDSPDGNLDAPEYQASLGLRHVGEHFHWTVAVTENLLNFSNTPDLALHLSLGMRF